MRFVVNTRQRAALRFEKKESIVKDLVLLFLLGGTMPQQEIGLFAIKLVLGGFTAFLAILLWSKVYDAPWMALVGGAITGYAGIVYDMLRAIGVVDYRPKVGAGISLGTLAFTVVPLLFVITAFILMIARNRALR
jgi:hypothetical protein